jgi:hypothetical protein
MGPLIIDFRTIQKPITRHNKHLAMKHIYILVFILSVFLSYGQTINRLEKPSPEKIQITNQIVNDTLWVLDSSLYSQATSTPEVYNLVRTYKVLSRNDFGNPVTSSNIKSEGVYSSFNNEFDSIVYFDGKIIKKYFSKAWNSVDQDWILNEYEEYEKPEFPIELFNKNFSDNMQQYFYTFRKLYEYENDQVKTLIYETFNTDSENWVKKYKTDYYYNSEGEDTLQLIKSWRNSEWADSVRNHRNFEDGLLKNHSW